VIALEGIQDERFVGLWDFEVRKAATVRQIELGHYGLHAQAGQLRIHLDVDRFVGLDSDDELVARDVFEDAGCDVLELDADFGLLFIEGYGRSADGRSK